MGCMLCQGAVITTLGAAIICTHTIAGLSQSRLGGHRQAPDIQHKVCTWSGSCDYYSGSSDYLYLLTGQMP